jgi:hypothetical protein
MDNFIGYFRKVTTNKLKVNNQLEIGNKAIFAGTGTTYYVDSDASNAADTNSGRSWSKPLASIDGAINKCTANQGDTIILAESHSETYTTTGAKFVADVAGITIIGLGEGSDRATLTFSHTGATTTISAANVTIYNVLFVTGIDSVVTYGTISGADCKLINCETRDAAAKEVIDAFTVTTTASRFKAYGHKHIGDVSTGDASKSIFNLTDVSDFEIRKCAFITLCGTGVIEIASTGINGIIDNCLFRVAGTSDLSLNVVDTDGDSTVIVRNCYDLEAMSSFSGGNAGSGFSVAGDDVGAIATALSTVDGIVDDILVDTGTTIPAQITSKIPDVVTKSVSSVANGNTNLFDLVGEVEIESIYGVVTTATEDAACTYKFDFYDGTTATDLCTTTSIQDKVIGTNLAIDGTFANALAVTAGNVSQGQSRKIELSDGGGTGNGKIRGVASAAITGEVTFYCKYKKLSTDGAITATA